MKKIVLILSMLVSSVAFAGMKEIYTDTGDAVNAYFQKLQLEVVSVENYALMEIGGTEGDIGVRTDVSARAAGGVTVSAYHCLTYFSRGADDIQGPHFEVVDTDCNLIK